MGYQYNGDICGNAEKLAMTFPLSFFWLLSKI